MATDSSNRASAARGGNRAARRRSRSDGPDRTPLLRAAADALYTPEVARSLPAYLPADADLVANERRRATTIADAAAALRSGAVTSVELTAELLAAGRRPGRRARHVRRPFRRGSAGRRGAGGRGPRGGHRPRPAARHPPRRQGHHRDERRATTAQQGARSHGAAVRTAPAVARLRADGAVITGKTTTIEFAWARPTTRAFPTPRNPWDLERGRAGRARAPARASPRA